MGLTDARNRGTAARDERGAALVEFAVILPLLLMLTLGMVSAASGHNRRMQLTHAAREGARYGATLPLKQCTGSPNPCGSSNWAQVVRSVVVERSTGDLTASNVCVALVNGSAGTPISSAYTTKADGTACYSDGSGDPAHRVQVLVTRSGDQIDAFVVKFPLTLTSRATAKFEQ